MHLQSCCCRGSRANTLRKTEPSGDRDCGADGHLAVLGPFVLAADLLLFFGSEVIRDVERLSDLLGRLALDHVGDRLATDVEKGLDVKEVGCLG